MSDLDLFADVTTEPEPDPELDALPPSARTITADLMARLERHYIRPGQDYAGGIFVPEVGENGAWGASRRCDAIYVGFTSTSGRMFVGHEVKATRADWLHELAQPGKADAWADQCHEWWIVTIPGVVAPGELPEGWGLMVPSSRTRMKVITRAHRHPARQPSWDAVRSVMARYDTLRMRAIANGLQEAQRKASADFDARVTAAIEARTRAMPDAEALRERLARYERALAGRLVDTSDPYGYGGRREFTDAQLTDVAALLRTHGDLRRATEHLVGRYTTNPLQVLRRRLDELDAVVSTALDSLPKAEDGAA